MASNHHKIRKTGRNIVTYSFLIVWLIFALFPIYWVAIMSIKDVGSVYGTLPTYIPYIDFQPCFRAWARVIGGASVDGVRVVSPVLGRGARYLINSILVAGGSSVITVALGTLAGYALTRFKYRRISNDGIAFFILSQRIFPPVALAVPFFILFAWAGMVDELPSLIIVYSIMNMPIVTWIVKEFFNDIPKEIEEAAMVDGSSRWNTLLKIFIPLAIPGVAVAFLFSFVFAWNEFLLALVLTFENNTLPVTMSGMWNVRGPRYWDIAANAMVIMLPPLVVTILANKYIIKGLSLGAVDGG